MNKNYEFILEIWEITNIDKKLVGTRNIEVVAEFDAEAIKKAWIEAGESLTHHYFYCLRYK